MEKVVVYILAGGKSSRFGSDKARATLDGKALIMRVAEIFSPVAASTTVVADTVGKYDDLGLVTIEDAVAGVGPLGGLLAALRHRGEGWVLLTSCDVAAFKAEWVETLQRAMRPGVQAAAFKREFWQPLPALYHSSIAPLVQKQIDQKTLALWKLLDASDSVAVPLPQDWAQFRQINTQQELTDFTSGANTGGSF